ncbi:metalloprotease [Mycobacterium phage Pharaoh]|uniref:Metalloprotease n=1 Tax=Mycobacterium phage Pharaoh TaxID=2530140 RepID=A0A481W2N9_9CAUD|nr:peptidase [Mycobacterium phage Pharaoh]QBJ00192.1 metalloprotease [Mycobacterium phage Pharaoh]
MTATEMAREQKYLDALPEHLRVGLAQRGTRVFVGGRADQSPGWAATGIKSHELTADGRELGDLSFYLPNRNEVFISSRSPHGSQNVYVHELGHAVDYKWIKPGGVTVTFGGKDYEVRIISDDPFFRAMHQKYILNNPDVRQYYRTGSQGTASSGRRESVAEGLAEYTKNGRQGLVNLFHSEEAASYWIKIMQRYGVIK